MRSSQRPTGVLCAALLACAALTMGQGCPFGVSLPSLGGSSSQDQTYVETFSRTLDDAAAFGARTTTFDSVAPDRDFVVDLIATPLGDSSVVCVDFAGCDDTFGAQVTFRCAEVEKTFDIALEQQGANVVGRFSRAANEAGECTAIGGQRSRVAWDVILTRFENEAIRVEVTVEWTDFDDVLQ